MMLVSQNLASLYSIPLRYFLLISEWRPPHARAAPTVTIACISSRHAVATEQNWIPVGDMSERKRESDGKIARSYIHPRRVVGGGSTLTLTIVAYAPSYSYAYV